MSKRETKVVLGRRFTRTDFARWVCKTRVGELCLYDNGHTGAKLRWTAALERPDWCDTGCTIEVGLGDTEADAILELQATLRKMAELEVAE